jgi:transposase InsO family protein
LASRHLAPVFEQLKAERGLPDVLRTDNGPELLGEASVSWCEANGDYIAPGKPNQNASIERFDRSYRDEVLDTWRSQIWMKCASSPAWMSSTTRREIDGFGRLIQRSLQRASLYSRLSA